MLLALACGLSLLAQAAQDICLRNATVPQFSPAVAVHKNIVVVVYTEAVGFFETVIGGNRSEDGGETFIYLGSLPYPCPGCPPHDQGFPALVASEEGVFYLSFVNGRGTHVFHSLDGGESFMPVLSLDAFLLYPQLLVKQEKIYLLGWQVSEGQELWKWPIVLFIKDAEGVTGPMVVAEYALDAVFGNLVELGGLLYHVYLKWNIRELVSPIGIADQLAALGEDLLREFCARNPAELWISISGDGGRTWGSPVLLTPIEIPCQVEALDSKKVASFISGGLEVPLSPAAAADPRTGTIYIAYQSASAGKIEVFLMAVNGKLEVVLPPRSIAQDPQKERFLPALAVSPAGVIGVLFYELDPLARKIDVYLGQSGDGGKTFHLERVNSISSPIPPVAGQPTKTGHFYPSLLPGYIGDSLGIDADENFFYVAWVDFRNVVVTPDYPKGRPDMDIYLARVPIKP